MQALQIFNGLEAARWFLLSVIVVVRARDDSRSQRCWTAALAVVLFVFGVSDVIEIFTGAFWRPWWLLLINGYCVVSIFVCGVVLWRLRPATKTAHDDAL